MINNNVNNENINQSNHEENKAIKIDEQENNINKDNSLEKEKGKIGTNINEIKNKENKRIIKEINEKERKYKRVRNKTDKSGKKLKIKRSFRKILIPLNTKKEDTIEKHIKENKVSENDLEGMSEEGSCVTIKKDGNYLIDDEEQKILISKS